jgi:hypothetical protein
MDGGVPRTDWHRSRRCETGGCVEVARIGERFAIRDSHDTDSVLRFDPVAWAAFTDGVRAGEFDLR